MLSQRIGTEVGAPNTAPSRKIRGAYPAWLTPFIWVFYLACSTSAHANFKYNYYIFQGGNSCVDNKNKYRFSSCDDPFNCPQLLKEATAKLYTCYVINGSQFPNFPVGYPKIGTAAQWYWDYKVSPQGSAGGGDAVLLSNCPQGQTLNPQTGTIFHRTFVGN